MKQGAFSVIEETANNSTIGMQTSPFVHILILAIVGKRVLSKMPKNCEPEKQARAKEGQSCKYRYSQLQVLARQGCIEHSIYLEVVHYIMPDSPCPIQYFSDICA